LEGGGVKATLTFRILGCGSSTGVPRLGNQWGDCDPANPKNRRSRCSLLITRETADGATRVLVDTTPDLRSQLLDAGVGELDAVVYTHSHADHTHGIDDLRQIVFNIRRRLPVWADGPTQESLINRFGYAFVQPANSAYPPILEMNVIDGPFTVEGAGGPVTLTPFEVEHGTIDALGFRVGGVAYLPDVLEIPEASWAHLQGLEVWIVDALRRTPHPTHAHLAKTLDWIERVRPVRAVLTNMHMDLDYGTVAAEVPAHVTPAHDGMTITLPA
jgi:phosphoribosyl 1,2-cyclic phosphate phosphodiesterase